MSILIFNLEILRKATGNNVEKHCGVSVFDLLEQFVSSLKMNIAAKLFSLM